MKKGLILLVVLFLSVCLFADDAMVLPSGVLRATFANSLINTNSVYDDKGKVDKEDIPEIVFDNLGAALEFGITDDLTAAVQWAPGVMVYSDISKVPAPADIYAEEIVFTGLADLFLGAKYQFIETDLLRFALAGGAKIPLDSYDTEQEIENFKNGDGVRMSSQSSTETLGLGGRAYFDIKLHKNFYVNFYNQTIYYMTKELDNPGDALTYAYAYQSAKDLGASDAVAEATAEGTLDALGTGAQKTEFGVYLDFEVEPHFKYDLSKTAEIGLGVPVKYSWTPDVVVEDENETNSGGYDYSVAPALSFFYKGGFPFELTAQYDWSLGGMNASKANIFIVKLKLFYDFY